MTTDRLVSIAEAAQTLGLGLTRLYAEVAAGRLELVKNGRRSYIRSTEIARYIAALPARCAEAAAPSLK